MRIGCRTILRLSGMLLTIGLACSSASAQIITIPFHFKTDDHILPSVWGPFPGGVQFDYTAGTPGDVSGNFGANGSVNLPILGTFGGGVQGSAHANAGLRFHFFASGGSVTADLPLTLYISPYVQTANSTEARIFVYFALNSNATIKTTSPDAGASVNLYLDAGVQVGANATAFSQSLFSTNDIFQGKLQNINFDKLTSLPAFLSFGSSLGFVPSLVTNPNTQHQEIQLFNFDLVNILNSLGSGLLTLPIKDDYDVTVATLSLKFPLITASGSPSSSGAQNIISANAHDWFVQFDADLTNMLASIPEDTIGTPLPIGNFPFQFPQDNSGNNDNSSAADIEFDCNVLDLNTYRQLGFEQNFVLTMLPQLTLTYQCYDAHATPLLAQPGVLGPYTVGNSQANAIPIGFAVPQNTATIQLTPTLTPDNGFSSQLKLWGNVGISLDVLSASAKLNVKGIDIFDAGFQAIPPLDASYALAIPIPGVPDFYHATDAYPGDPIPLQDTNGNASTTAGSFTIPVGDTGVLFGFYLSSYGGPLQLISVNNGGASDGSDPETLPLTLISLPFSGTGASWPLNTSFYFDYQMPGQTQYTIANGITPDGAARKGYPPNGSWRNEDAWEAGNGTQVTLFINPEWLTLGIHTITAIVPPDSSTGSGQVVASGTFEVNNYVVPVINGLFYLSHSSGDENDSVDHVSATNSGMTDAGGNLPLQLTGGGFDPGIQVLWFPADTLWYPTLPANPPATSTPLKVIGYQDDRNDYMGYVNFQLPALMLSQPGYYWLTEKNPGSGGQFPASPNPNQLSAESLRIYAETPTATGVVRKGGHTNRDAQHQIVPDFFYRNSGDMIAVLKGTGFVQDLQHSYSDPSFTFTGTRVYLLNPGSSGPNITQDTLLPQPTYVDANTLLVTLPGNILNGLPAGNSAITLYTYNLFLSDPTLTLQQNWSNSNHFSSMVSAPLYNFAPTLNGATENPKGGATSAVPVFNPDVVSPNATVSLRILGGTAGASGVLRGFQPGCTVTVNGLPVTVTGPPVTVPGSPSQEVDVALPVTDQTLTKPASLPTMVISVSNPGQKPGVVPQTYKLRTSYPQPQIVTAPARFYADDPQATLPLVGDQFFPASQIAVAGQTLPSGATTYIDTYPQLQHLTLSASASSLPSSVVGATSLTVVNPSTDSAGLDSGTVNASTPVSIVVLRDFTAAAKVTTSKPVRIDRRTLGATVTVTANRAIKGPVWLMLSNLQGGVARGNSGVTTLVAPLKSPIYSLGGALKAGQSLTLNLKFTGTVPAKLSFTPRIIAGGAP
jgi:hypothetical protein